MEVIVTADAFDPGEEANAFMARTAGAGAAVTFTGIVRSKAEDPILALELECYVELAESQIAAILAEAARRFSLIDATVIHRHGRLVPGEPIMQVMTAAPHREDAFRGAQFLMDYLKTDAPFWKKEVTASGERWVEAKKEDDAARERWE
ncbi:molybdenum cofactor biosynthesis protein MoaE [Devosia nitrariae]|uniref:Molybdopterin synthase catalytic subunit n=1 Tax=Devosia nitrariae TaxID=2071872 RepID=A0ABQ5VYN5_9HYPH|nr:molybdenum cofactor biosynthesis protein MoaE [Devosia nitrariae]GLQ52761.1 molybdopterin synthase catalytic subunit [Devosia nitrariae]